MTTIPLHHLNSHLFLELSDGLWMHDTGAPASFGNLSALRLLDQEFEITDDYMGLNAKTLSELVGIECQGLLGADVLGAFDQLIDLPGGQITFSTDELSHSGELLKLEEFMGIPIVSAMLAGEPFRLFFDTGAQLSYLQNDIIESSPPAGSMEDFYPGFGKFETATHMVPYVLGSRSHTFRTGRLPGLLGMSLMMADADGILGNTLLEQGPVGYFPRRGLLSI